MISGRSEPRSFVGISEVPITTLKELWTKKQFVWMEVHLHNSLMQVLEMMSTTGWFIYRLEYMCMEEVFLDWGLFSK
ncbi:hypothetical protein Hanom_Chr08g00747911 [Helianthus anomalus]